jgi:hypothetical protein
MKGRRDGEQNKTRDVFSLLDGGSGSEASRAYFGGNRHSGKVSWGLNTRRLSLHGR